MIFYQFVYQLNFRLINCLYLFQYLKLLFFDQCFLSELIFTRRWNPEECKTRTDRKSPRDRFKFVLRHQSVGNRCAQFIQRIAGNSSKVLFRDSMLQFQKTMPVCAAAMSMARLFGNDDTKERQILITFRLCRQKAFLVHREVANVWIPENWHQKHQSRIQVAITIVQKLYGGSHSFDELVLRTQKA